MYVMIYGVKRTTIYLPEDLKARLTALAQREGVTESEVIRRAIAEAVARSERPKPRAPLVESTGETTDWASRVDELLDDGFGMT